MADSSGPEGHSGANRAVLFVSNVPEGAVQRLERGGVHAAHCQDEAQEWGLAPGQVLVVGKALPGMLCWEEVGQQAAGQPPTADRVMQAVVQYNRKQLLSAHQPTSASTAGTTSAAPAAAAQRLLVVGYVMKASREEQLSSSGLLHLHAQDSMCFMPFDATRLHEQQGHIDILLHKGSDELVPTADGGVVWSDRLLQLQEWLKGQPHICVVDPFQNTKKVLDRLQLSLMLDQLQHMQLPGGVRARAPRYIQVQDFTAAEVSEQLSAAGLQPPYIVKPLVACGVKHSHSMALVLLDQALQQLQGQVPSPAVVQEFVNHGGVQYKVYVLGEKVFVAPRASIPDVFPDPSQPFDKQLLLFDSLASLPTELPPHMTQQQGAAPASPTQPDMQAVEAVAAFLRNQLGLTLFGFDVVVSQQPNTGFSTAAAGGISQLRQKHQHQELIVLDVNYFPNYRGGSETPALFRAALRQCWERHQQTMSTEGMRSAAEH